MSTVEEIESAIQKLPRDQFYRLLAWLRAKYEDEWDRQIEEDAKAGRFENLAAEALAEYRTGRAK